MARFGASAGDYFYVVKGEDADGDESNASPEASGTIVEPQCNNGIDDDADTFIDLLDPGCSDALDNDESDA